MGTIGDWGRILVISVFAGLYGWARDMGHKPYLDKPGRSLAGWFLFTIVVGIWYTFRWQALKAPLAFITVPTAIAGVILMFSARPRRAQQAAEALSVEKHK